MKETRNLLFDAQSKLNSIARSLDLAPDVLDLCNQYIRRYYSTRLDNYSNPPVVVASVLYLASRKLGDGLSVNTITSACGISVRWFEKRRDQITRHITGT